MKNLLFIFVSLLGITSYAQDIITTKKGEDIKAKVLEINIQDVKYKKVENPDSPIYTLLKSDILMIRYENGSKDIFNEESKETQVAKNSGIETKNRISIVEKQYFLNGERITRGEMKNILYRDTEARDLYGKSISLKTGSDIFATGSIICSTISIVLLLGDIANTNNDKKKDSDSAAVPLLIAGGGLLIPSFILQRAASKKKAEAVEAYNRNQEKKVSIIPTIGAGSAGLVIRF